MTVKNDTHYFRDADFYISKATGGVDFRAKNCDSIENVEKILDFYASVKSLYLQDRQQKILNSKIVNTKMIVIGKKLKVNNINPQNNEKK